MYNFGDKNILLTITPITFLSQANFCAATLESLRHSNYKHRCNFHSTFYLFVFDQDVNQKSIFLVKLIKTDFVGLRFAEKPNLLDWKSVLYHRTKKLQRLIV
jgi:hypothetical protein